MNLYRSNFRLVFSAFALLACVILWAGCEPSTSTTDGQDPIDTLPMGNLQDATEECSAIHAGQFCIAGFDFLKIGDSLIWNNAIAPSIAPVSAKDTVFEDYVTLGETVDTTAWFVKILRYPDGDVFLEQDFENPHLMGRIRIETAGYAHASGLKVGSTVKDLKAQFREIIPQPFPEYQVMDLIVPYSGRRMVYQVPLGNYYQAGKEEYGIGDIPEDLKVVRIVIM